MINLEKFNGQDIWIRADMIESIIVDPAHDDWVRIFMHGSPETEYYQVRGKLCDVARIINESLTSSSSSLG